MQSRMHKLDILRNSPEGHKLEGGGVEVSKCKYKYKRKSCLLHKSSQTKLSLRFATIKSTNMDYHYMECSFEHKTTTTVIL